MRLFELSIPIYHLGFRRGLPPELASAEAAHADAIRFMKVCFKALPAKSELDWLLFAVFADHVEIFRPRWRGPDEKTATMQALAAMFEDDKPLRYSIISETWMAQSNENDPLMDIEPHKREDRQDGILILTVERDGPILATAYVVEHDWKTGKRSLSGPDSMTPDSIGGRMTELMGDR